MHLNFITLAIFSPKGFALSHRVIGNNLVCGVENILRTAVVLFKTDNLCALEGIFKGKDIFNRSSSEFIDTLVIVADNADIAVFFGEHTDKLVLHLVGVLILVNHYVLKLILIIFKHLGALFKKQYGITEHIVKIHCV